MAVKGVDGFDRTTPVAGPTNIEARQGAKRSRGGAKLWTVAVAVFKSELYRFLRQDRPTDEDLDAGAAWPAGYVHLPKGLDAERVKQLVAEQLVTVKTRRGFDKLEWQKLRARNETLDCRVYARAAAWVAGVDRFTDGRWAQLEAQLAARRARTRNAACRRRRRARQAGASYRPVPHRRRVATSSWMTE